MKNIILLAVIVLLMGGCVSSENDVNNNLLNESYNNLSIKNNNSESSLEEKPESPCHNQDNNQEGCMTHNECRWITGEDICKSAEEVNDDEGLNPELEAISVPDTVSNGLCKKLPLSPNLPYGERYYCLAIINHNERFCDGMDEENEELICLALANEDPSYCKQLEDNSAKHVCYYQLAVSSENANFCGEINYNQNEKEQCYFNFMSNLYSWGKSNEIKTEYCSELDTPDEKTCLALKARDISLCGDNPNCLTFFKQDVSFCDKHPEMDSCMKDRAKTGKDVSICGLLSQPDKDNCIGSYCTHTELDVSICDTINDVKERQSRYIELAINLANL